MSPEVPESKVIQNIVEAIWDSGEPNIDLSLWCAKELAKHFPHWSDLEINDVLDEVIGKVKSRLRKKIRDLREKGTMPLYEFSDILTDTLLKSKDISFADLRRIKSAITNMSWIKFQHLCKYLLELNGIEKAEVTRGSKEGGIDVYGLLRVDKYSTGVVLKGIEIRIIVQTRHHSTPTKVGDTELKVFSQQSRDFKDGVGRGAQVLPEWFVKLKSPVTPMFITNTGFTKGAYDVARQEGIIPKDGDQILQDLISSPRLNEWLYTQEKHN